MYNISGFLFDRSNRPSRLSCLCFCCSDDTVYDVCRGTEPTYHGEHHFTMSEDPA